MLEYDSKKMKWILAMRIATSPSERWLIKAAEWNPVLDRMIHRTRAGSDAFSVDSCALHPSLLPSLLPSLISSFLLWKKRRQREKPEETEPSW